ncbi:methionyl-tRNA formyltransferase [Stagnimonas aquatica]|uniref:Methionyl-tRNA formyltransferase n=1 Tax=Stagnimonas aquatica TaxID=2689987 RepID=A0A3N0VM90_9GAMM|nr:methionyl-tRNA formyltransferase [Stagnimonas aquatica]ROH93138.1 methionyl-tRNA formyltransferase [Stagnimonas aquatica]
MRLVFAGTPEFSVAALDALVAAGHEIVGVYTQPDRPFGRGQKLTPSPVAQRASALGLAVHKPVSLRKEPEALATLRALAPEAMVVVAYGQILPQSVLDIPRLGCLNIHASLLPRWRGAAPIQRAILAGDAETGVTIMRMDAGLDTGPMLLWESLPIGEMTAGELHDALMPMGARLIVEALRRLEAGTLPDVPQPAEGVTYATKLSKDEARIDWSLPAEEIARRIRGYNPVPGAWSLLAGERIKLLRANALPGTEAAVAGAVLANDKGGFRVGCGSDQLLVTEHQRPGGRPQGGPLSGEAGENNLRFESASQ